MTLMNQMKQSICKISLRRVLGGRQLYGPLIILENMCLIQGRPSADAAALGPAPQGHHTMVVEQIVHFCLILLALENCKKAYKCHCYCGYRKRDK